ncbi:MAG TPA: nucleotidyl transferase AbiEii/AbiGii toxin family protein [Bryobacteraceae bacterium]|nr:nucleotidyl transferase AbiEii/AbiGii toxin family protein [Bryobacteraceae bacterium]
MPNHEDRPWHHEVVAGGTEDAMRGLHAASLLAGFYLAGGTGLALWFGHWLSHDLDFFASELFDEESFLQRVQGQEGFSLIAKAPHTLHAAIQGTKVSFLGYAYPVLFPFARFSDVAVADPRDIACMKISAIASRGTKRDFIDLYVSAQRFGLAILLQLFARKYAQAGYSKIHILKSLTFFDDAGKDPMPDMLIPLEWDPVTQFFLQEVPRLF